MDKYDNKLENIENYYKFWENSDFSLEEYTPEVKAIYDFYDSLINLLKIYIEDLSSDKDFQEYVNALKEKYSYILQNKEKTIKAITAFDFYDIVKGIPYLDIFGFYKDIIQSEILPEIFELALFRDCWRYALNCYIKEPRNAIVRFLEHYPQSGDGIPKRYGLMSFADSYFRLEGRETFAELKKLVPMEDLYEMLKYNSREFLKHIPKQCIQGNKVTVYRGIAHNPEICDEQSGMSWTLSEDTAKFFSKRFSGNKGIVLKGKADINDIILYITMSSEEEILVDPSKVEREESFIVNESNVCSLENAEQRNIQKGIYWKANNLSFSEDI